MKIKVFNPAGEQVGTEDFAAGELGPVDRKVLYYVIKGYLANQRQGTSSTRSRARVRGGGRKPWRQKGTGRARVGSNRSPLWRGGGVVFGPSPRSYYRRIPASLRRKAFSEAFKDKLIEERIVLLSDYATVEPRTKIVSAFLGKASLDGKVTFYLSGEAASFRLAGRNIPNVSFGDPAAPNTYGVVNSDYLVIGRDCWEMISGRFRNESTPVAGDEAPEEAAAGEEAEK